MILLQEALEAHDRVSKGKYTIGLGQDCLAFCSEVEDVISMRSLAILHNHILIVVVIIFIFINSLVVRALMGCDHTGKKKKKEVLFQFLW